LSDLLDLQGTAGFQGIDGCLFLGRLGGVFLRTSNPNRWDLPRRARVVDWTRLIKMNAARDGITIVVQVCGAGASRMRIWSAGRNCERPVPERIEVERVLTAGHLRRIDTKNGAVRRRLRLQVEIRMKWKELYEDCTGTEFRATRRQEKKGWKRRGGKERVEKGGWKREGGKERRRRGEVKRRREMRGERLEVYKQAALDDGPAP
jgi:hypothetical protein